MNNEKIFENVIMKISSSNFEEKEEVKKPRTTALKIVAVFCLVMISITGITKGAEIRAFVEDVFDGGTHTEGVSTAMNNGYVSILQPDYKKTKDGIEVAVDSFLIDDFTIYLAFTVKVPDKYIEDINNTYLSFEKVTIRDEKGKKLYSTGDGAWFYNYLYEDDYKVSSCLSGSKYIENNKFICYMEIKGQFPRSKVLRVSVKDVVINNEKVYRGNLNYKLEVPKEMYEKKAVEYEVVSCSDDTTKVEKAILSNTELIIQYTTTRDIERFFCAEYITTSDGRRIGRSGGDGGTGYFPDNPTIEDPIKRTAPYALTAFDATDVIIYHIPTTDGDEILIELKR